jgi:hypothetical protein
MTGAVPSSEVLAGLVERVTFHNADNGFCVLWVKARGHRELITVVGLYSTRRLGIAPLLAVLPAKRDALDRQDLSAGPKDGSGGVGGAFESLVGLHPAWLHEGQRLRHDETGEIRSWIEPVMCV